MGGRKDSGKKSKESVKVDLSSEDIQDIIDIEKMKTQMETTLNYLKKELTEQLALRLSLSTVANIPVECEDGKVPLSQLGQVQQKSPQMMLVNMIENPQYTNAAKTAILNSGINVTPQVEGVTLYLPIQKVTREHREKLAKNAKAICDKCKEKLRNIQNNYDRLLKQHQQKGKNSTSAAYSQDLILDIHNAIMATTKDYCSKVDDMMLAKQDELLKS
ncbi:hypothetical protein HELRODRAFT_88163 [Helobdella robusta]|uniref:Ribosome-recycling factor, mitochondrial n=1 Tax=Helobdella robusta TaxID=6412 RepID=T1G6Z2_HELRO|nr:hypothetical protein HELRODRAFT_88163 [Helobdella robusta]ESN93777.1 hypothetical protein HELRODRAFT_88163 [Helobdella robusta]